MAAWRHGGRAVGRLPGACCRHPPEQSRHLLRQSHRAAAASDVHDLLLPTTCPTWLLHHTFLAFFGASVFRTEKRRWRLPGGTVTLLPLRLGGLGCCIILSRPFSALSCFGLRSGDGGVQAVPAPFFLYVPAV